MTASLSRLQTFYGDFEAEKLLHAMITHEFKGKIALTSSFGADALLLVEMVAKIDPTVPVLFLETGKHFQATLDYVKDCEKRLGLKNLRHLRPREDLLQNIDPQGDLWKTQVNRCCWMRKVEPLSRELAKGEFDAVITGRKSFQTAERQDMDSIELFNDGIFRINPLLTWSKEAIKQAFIARDLPQHPLIAQGYPSIGCEPCTKIVKPGEDERSGRWAHTMDTSGVQKQECGIHIQQGKVEETTWSI